MTGLWTLLFLLVVSSTTVLDVSEGAILGKRRREHERQRSVGIRNKSKRSIDIMWISLRTNADEEKYVSNTDNEGLQYGGETSISSFVGHEFEIWELPSKSTGKCRFEECRKVYFQVTEPDGQEIEVTPDFHLIRTDDQMKAKDQAKSLIATCQAQLIRDNVPPGTPTIDDELWNVLDNNAKEATSAQLSKLDDYWISLVESALLSSTETSYQVSPLSLLESLHTCVESQLNQTMDEKQNDVDFESSLRQRMASKLPSYACLDATFQDTIETENRTFVYTENMQREQYNVQVLHERPQSSLILKVQNFFTPQECRVLDRYLSTNPEQTQIPSQIPWSSLDGTTTESFVMHQLVSKTYNFAKLALQWKDLEMSLIRKLDETNLFQIHAPTATTSTTTTTTIHNEQEEDGSTANVECSATKDGTEDQVCQLTSSLSPLVQSISITDPTIVGRAFVFCHNPSDEEADGNNNNAGNGGIQFPYAGVHINPQHGLLVFATFSDNDVTTAEEERFTQDYSLCPPQRMYSHTFRHE